MVWKVLRSTIEKFSTLVGVPVLPIVWVSLTTYSLQTQNDGSVFFHTLLFPQCDHLNRGFLIGSTKVVIQFPEL